MTTAQVIFAIALGSLTLLITVFAVYVLSTTVWGNRWFRPGQATSKSEGGREHE